MSRKILFTHNQALKGPFSFGLQLSDTFRIARVKTAPFGTLPGEVNGATVFLGFFRIFHER